MPSNPTVTIGQLPNHFIGENIDLTLSFNNEGDTTGFGPFIVLFLDKTGADGDDGLTFADASYLGSAVTTSETTLTGSTSETVTVHDEDYVVTVPSEFGSGDSLVVIELPFGSFVSTQPIADISVSLDGSNLADRGTPLNIASQAGFVFGESETGTTPTIGSVETTFVSPQLVTLQKNYLGPEDETATGPNFKQQYEVVVDIAPGQTIKDLDISDILPDTMQFVRVVSIEDKDGAVDPGRITEVSTPDDGGLGSIGGDNFDTGDDDIPVVGGKVTRRIDSVVGGDGDLDLVMTVEFFVPRLDASGNVIIDAASGDDVFDQNESELGNNLGDGNNTWTPLDPRDPNPTPDSSVEVYIPPTVNDNGTLDNFPNSDGSEDDSGDEFNNPDKVLEEQSIAIQKSVVNVNGLDEFKPGDILEYTIEFQVSDYFAFEDVLVEDTFSDGQRFDAGFAPILSFNEHNNTAVVDAEFSSVGNLAANYTQVGSSGSGGSSVSDFIVIDETDINNPAASDGSGDTVLTFDVSGLLATQAGQDNQLVGGGVPGNGFDAAGTNLNNNPPLNTGFGGTTGTITFRTIVQDTFSDNFPSGDPSVDSSDRLENDAIINGAILDVDTLIANGNQEADDTHAEIAVAAGNLYKSIYAINGVIYDDDNDSSNGFAAANDINLSNGLDGYTSGINVDPGDEITYRLSFELPVSDVEQLTLQDFLPLPAYDVNQLSALTFDTNRSNLADIPLAGESKYGPAHTFAQDPTSPEGGLSFDPNGNSLLYDFGSYDDPSNQSAVVDVLVTATIQDNPVADGLVFTNQVSQSQQNTFNEPSSLDAIVQINLRQPDVSITKDIVSATNGDPNALEAGDIVTFSVTLENTGTSESGAFDAKINDLIPDGFIVPTVGGINVQAEYGDGTTVNSRGGNLTFSSAVNSVTDGDEIEIELIDDPGATAAAFDDFGALEGVNNPDKNKVVVTYDLEVSNSLSGIYTGANNGITNTARATFANINDGEEFSEIEDTADVSVVQPEITKEFVTTSEGSTDNQDVAIGEIIRYRLVAKIPEGTLDNLTLRDRLPRGLTFLNDNTAKVGFVSTNSGISSSSITASDIPGDETSLSSLASSDIAVVLGDASISNDPDLNSDSYATGTDIYFKLGNVTNADNDNSNSEYVVVEFNALVDNNNDLTLDGAGNDGTNDAGDELDNQVTLLSNDSTGTLVEYDTSADVTVKILEPNITVDKQVEDPDTGNFVDTTTSNFVQADTGDSITFQTIFTNDGTDATTAFDVTMSDELPAALSLDLGSITAVDSNGTAVNLITTNSSGNTVTINVDQLPVGETITVTYDANIGASVTPEQLIISTAEVDYSSLPGTNGTTTNDTGSSNTGTSGDIEGERNNDPTKTGGTANDYVVSDDGHIKAPPLEPIKTIVATSETFTSEADSGVDDTVDPINGADPVEPRDVTIGEIVRYRLEVGIPEGTIPDLAITDLLPAGLRYLDDDTAKVAFLSNGGGVTSSTLGGAPQVVPGVSGDGSVPTAILPDAAVDGDGGDDIFDSGDVPTFNLGTITNVDSDGDGESIVIEFNAVVENVTGNQDATKIDNSFEVSSSAPSATVQTSNLSINRNLRT